MPPTMRLSDLETEKNLLSRVAFDPSIVTSLSHVSAEAFTAEPHRVMWRGILQLSGQVFTTSALRAHLGEAATQTVREAIREAEESGFTSAGYEIEAARLVSLWRRRRMVAAAREAAEAAASSELSDAEAIARAEACMLAATTAASGSSNIVHIGDAVSDAIKDAWDRSNSTRGYVRMGLPDLTQTMGGGLRPGEVCIVAARPGCGKSAFAAQVARHAAVDRIPTLFVSIEMSKEDLGLRWVAAESGVALNRLRDPKHTHQSEWAKIESIVGPTSQALTWLLDEGEVSLASLRAAVQRGQSIAQQPLGLIIVDYLQIMQADTKQRDRRVQVDELSRGIKQLARKVKAPVLLLAQLSREVEKGARPPRLSDLRESGSLEQDADSVLFLHRPEEGYRSGPQRVQVLVAKQRNGPLGTHEAMFDGSLQRFTEVKE